MSSLSSPAAMAPPNVKSFKQLEAEREAGSPYPKCSLFLRGGARIADLLLASGIYLYGGRPGPVLAILFLLLADGMLQGQSPGKRIFGVKVMHLPTLSAGRKRDSTLRNAPLALVVLLGMMPELGAPALIAGAIVIGSIETWRTFRDPLGLRFGDIWAQTQVVDGKVVANAGVAARDGHRAAERVTGRALLAARRRRPLVVHRRSIRCASR